VNCHNSHAKSPKTDWKLGDVRGVLEVTTSIEPQLKQNAGLVRVAAFLIGGTALGIVILVVLIMRSVSARLGKTMQVFEAVAAAGGDLTREISVFGDDDIGQLGHGLDRFLTTLRVEVAGIGKNATTLAGSSEELSAVSTQMSANAQETAAQAGAVSTASEQVS